MTVDELEKFFEKVKDKKKTVYFYNSDDNPFDESVEVENVFEVSGDAAATGAFEGVYLKGN